MGEIDVEARLSEASDDLDFWTKDVEITIRLTPRGDGRYKSIDRREEERFYAALQYGIVNDVPMSELASRCCLSLSTFKRRFKQWVGGSPREWIVAKRMEVASEVLSKADITISSLAKMCCYNNTSHFIEIFKRHYGTTPHTFRQQMARQKMVLQRSSYDAVQKL